MNNSVSLAEAKATLSECIRRVEKGKSLLITRHGKPVAALVRAEDLANFERLRRAGPEGGLASLAGGWEGSDELAQLIDESRRIGQRDVKSLEYPWLIFLIPMQFLNCCARAPLAGMLIG